VSARQAIVLEIVGAVSGGRHGGHRGNVAGRFSEMLAGLLVDRWAARRPDRVFANHNLKASLENDPGRNANALQEKD
jgi:hypothetical protein